MFSSKRMKAADCLDRGRRAFPLINGDQLLFFDPQILCHVLKLFNALLLAEIWRIHQNRSVCVVAVVIDRVQNNVGRDGVE